jgi:hypothetical protein
MNELLEQYASALTRSGDYSVLRRLQPRTDFEPELMLPLAHVFESVVRERPTEFSEHAGECAGLGWAHIRAFLWAIAPDVTTGPMPIAWDRLLDLFHHIVDELHGGALPDVRAAENGASKVELLGALGQLLRDGFSNGRHPPEIGVRDKAWAVIVKLMSHTDPDIEDESVNDLRDRFPHEVRGLAMQAAMAHLVWRWKYLSSQKADLGAGLAAMPEVKALLAERLDPTFEPSLQVRASYGHYFPWLFEIDRAWAIEMAPRIFPHNDPDRWEAAWLAYLWNAPVYNPTFGAMRGVYECAIGKLKVKQNDQFKMDQVERRIGEHLLNFFFANVPGSEETLLKYMDGASPKGRQSVFELLGRSFAQVEARMDVGLKKRVVHLWDSRLQAAKAKMAKSPASQDQFVGEFAAFGSTFVFAGFEIEWSLPFLREALIISGYIDQTDAAIDLLLNIAPDRIGEIIDCVREILRTGPHQQGWRYMTSKLDLAAILAFGLEADQETAAKVVKIANDLTERGDPSFEGLLRPRSDEDE